MAAIINLIEGLDCTQPEIKAPWKFQTDTSNFQKTVFFSVLHSLYVQHTTHWLFNVLWLLQPHIKYKLRPLISFSGVLKTISVMISITQ